MPSPTSADEFLELVRKSGVVDDKRLDAYLEPLRAAGLLPPEPSKLAGLMVRDGVLTHFQAEQFLLGKWRRFTVGKYKVLERLGAGGMGSVFLCEHKLMRRRVAVKVLPSAKADDPAALERFYLEARAVAALDHPNIVRAYDIDQDDKLHFLVMEHVDGASLQEIVKRSGPLDPVRAAHYVRQAALGLQHAHEAAGIVHRDIKPGNILVDRNGVVKILDMGLALFFHEDAESITRKYDENVLGTADYLAPEQALNSHEVDIRADIYSLGATFYYCLTGRTPFADGSVAQKLIWHQTRLPKPVKVVRPDVPDGLVAVLEKAMAKDPAQRYPTPQAMAEALDPWTQTPIPPPSPEELPQLSRAAMGPTGPETAPGAGPRTPFNGMPSTSPRRSWQVPPSGTALIPKEAKPAPAPAPAPAAPEGGPPRAEVPAPAPLPSPAPGVATQAPPPAPAAPPAGAEDEAMPWDKLSGDTQDVMARADTAPYRSRRKTVHVPAAPAPRRVFPAVDLRRLLAAVDFRRPRVWAAAAGAAAALLVLAVLLWWILRGPGDGPGPAPPPLPVLRVDPNGANGAFRSLNDAVHKARKGQHIVLVTNICEKGVSTDGCAKGLTIEAAPDAFVTWTCPSKVGPWEKLLTLGAAEGYVLRGITLDGGGRLDDVVSVWGACPGLRLERLDIKGFKKHGIEVTNCAGSAQQPVVFDHLRFHTAAKDQSGIFFNTAGWLEKDIPRTRYLSLRDCLLADLQGSLWSGDRKLLQDVQLP
jgi:serine/threonine protein kinase